MSPSLAAYLSSLEMTSETAAVNDRLKIIQNRNFDAQLFNIQVKSD